MFETDTTETAEKVLGDKVPVEIARNILTYIFRPTTSFQLRWAIFCWNNNKEYSLQKYGHISNWDTSEITNMSKLFASYHHFNDDISQWNVSNVRTFKEMFLDCYLFNKDISFWNVEKCEDFSYMFYRAQRFNQDLSKWKPKSARDLSYMFSLSRFGYDINNWVDYVDMNIPMTGIYEMRII
jgi:hypothetical protein